MSPPTSVSVNELHPCELLLQLYSRKTEIHYKCMITRSIRSPTDFSVGERFDLRNSSKTNEPQSCVSCASVSVSRGAC